ncbi:MAG: YihY/virulence factor BrkB family protein, partial [Actinomycetota bacterium]
GGGASWRGSPLVSARNARLSKESDDQMAGNEPAVEGQSVQDLNASSPLEVSPRGWKETFKRTFKEIKDDRITLISAGMAFYFFLAVFPALIAAAGVLGLINDSLVGNIGSTIQSTIPGDAADILVKALNNAAGASDKASLIAVIAGAGAALWSASSGMVAMQSGLNIAYDGLPERKFVKKRLVAIAMLVAVAVLGGAPSLFAFGDGVIFSIIGFAIAAVTITTLFALFYYLGPNHEAPHFRWITPGGILGAATWVVVSTGFGLYLKMFANASYAKTYGPLAGVIILIFWMYLSAMAILIGGELNAELERQTSPPRST